MSNVMATLAHNSTLCIPIFMSTVPKASFFLSQPPPYFLLVWPSPLSSPLSHPRGIYFHHFCLSVSNFQKQLSKSFISYVWYTRGVWYAVSARLNIRGSRNIYFHKCKTFSPLTKVSLISMFQNYHYTCIRIFRAIPSSRNVGGTSTVVL